MSSSRPTAVAGAFYPENPTELKNLLKQYHSPETQRTPKIAIMAPHAGYVYSGRFAGKVYQETVVPENVFVLCPNHTGRGSRMSVWADGSWESPLGEVKVATELAQELLQTLGIKGDRDAHRDEHAIEVHLPFLQWANPDVKIIPVVLGPLRVEDCVRVGAALSQVILKKGKEKCLIVASTDMSHYIPAREAKGLDKKALKFVEALDARGLYHTVAEEDISMCGFIPTTAVLEAAKELGATHSKILCYGHSGEITGDNSSVVAYASAAIS